MDRGANEALIALADALRAGAPATHGALAPGLPAEEVRRTLEASGLPPDDDLVSWFCWRNGTTASAEIAPEQEPLSLAEALALRRDQLSMVQELIERGDGDVGELWSGRWLPLMRTADHGVVVYVTGSADAEPRLLTIDFEDPDPRAAYDDVLAMACTLERTWRQGLLEVGEYGQVEALDSVRVQAIHEENNPRSVRSWISDAGAEDLRSLVTQLRDGGWPERSAAARALVDLRAVSSVPALLELMGTGEPALRRMVIGILRDLGDARAEASIVAAALHDPDPQVQHEALIALRNVPGDPAATALTRVLASPDPELRAAAVRSLVALRHPAALDPCLELLRDPSAAWRWTAACDLGDLGDARAVPDLIPALSDPNAQVRLNVAAALGKLGDPRGIAALRSLPPDPDPQVRRVIEAVLARATDAS